MCQDRIFDAALLLTNFKMQMQAYKITLSAKTKLYNIGPWQEKHRNTINKNYSV